MRTLACLGGMLLAAALCAGCETTQPDELLQQTGQIEVSASNAVVDVYNVWDLFEDSNGDGQPDDVPGPDFTLWCEGPVATAGAVSLPWPFSIEISILRAGQTVPEVRTHPASLVEGTNRALYDSGVLQGNDLPFPPGQNQQVPADGRTFQFTNQRRLTIANLDLILSDSNFLHDIDPGTYGGVCPGTFIGPPMIDDQEQPYTFDLNKGDTVLVKARRFNTPPAGITTTTEPSLNGTLTVDGLQVNVQGTTNSASEPDAGFSFSYTSR